MSVRYRPPPAAVKAPCLYIIQPNQGGRFEEHYKIGRSSTIDGRLSHYSTCYPKELGGYTIFGFLNTSMNDNVTAEKRCFELASKYNFQRIDKKAEFFKYTGDNIYKDSRELLLETRGGRFGDITAYDKNGKPQKIKGGHLNTDNILPTPLATTRRMRKHATYNGGIRVLRPLMPK
jgi:hypothetical protein